MEAEFWLERWQQNQIGFHQQEINHYLQEYWQSLGLEPAAEVLVPLCGKSRDLDWLRQRGHPVLGVELSTLAVEDFFRESGIAVQSRSESHFVAYRGDRIKLLCGDFFDLSPAHMERVAAVYDRAALIALPPAMRVRYSEQLARLLPASTVMLLLTLDYPQEQMSGPPFAVAEKEVRQLFAPHWTIEQLDAQDILDNESRFRERGLTRLVESCYRLRRRAG